MIKLSKSPPDGTGPLVMASEIGDKPQQQWFPIIDPNNFEMTNNVEQNL